MLQYFKWVNIPHTLIDADLKIIGTVLTWRLGKVIPDIIQFDQLRLKFS